MRNGPRAGSRAYLALQFLLQVGPLDSKDWMNHASISKSPVKFEREVTGPLTRWKLVDVSASGVFCISQAGRDFLDEREAEPVEQEVVAGRYAHPIQPLSARHRPQRPMRDGAFDYRDIPSRCASVSVPFKSSIKSEN
jgi:hypothetical protein